MIKEYFKVSDSDEPVLYFKELLKVKLRNDNVQSFNTRWDETMIAMKEQPDKKILENLYHRQHQQSEERVPLLSLYIQDTGQEAHRDFSRERQLEKNRLWR